MALTGEGEIRDWLKGRIDAGMSLGISSCAIMLKRLGSPEKRFPCVHVAGTNGKGSLCAHLSSLGSKNGKLIGLFTSPHLITVEERIRIDGAPISTSKLDYFLEKIRDASQIEPQIYPTYFETTFLASMIAFSEAGIDRAIVETGLGGRLDSTILVNADCCAITTISRDHTEVLGESLYEIALEKGGIYRKGIPLLCLHHEEETVREAIESIAGNDLEWLLINNSDAQEIAKSFSQEIGRRIGWEIVDTELKWPGRTEDENYWKGTEVILSAAHNEESLSKDIRKLSGREHVLVIGMTQKAELQDSVISLSNSSGRIYSIITEVDGGRKPSVPGKYLAKLISNLEDVPFEIITDNLDAIEEASRIAKSQNCIIFVTGSVYLVGKILSEIIVREGLDLWESLTIHPPIFHTEE